MTWTQERIEQFKALYAEGLSHSEIATEMGGITKSASIGKAHRLGLKARSNGKKAEPVSELNRAIPHEQRILSVLDLTNDRCKYPVGHPKEPGFFFCGAAVFARRYCRTHYQFCYQSKRLSDATEAVQQRCGDDGSL